MGVLSRRTQPQKAGEACFVHPFQVTRSPEFDNTTTMGKHRIIDVYP